jgi:hypothetical protein
MRAIIEFSPSLPSGMKVEKGHLATPIFVAQDGVSGHVSLETSSDLAPICDDMVVEIRLTGKKHHSMHNKRRRAD